MPWTNSGPIGTRLGTEYQYENRVPIVYYYLAADDLFHSTDNYGVPWRSFSTICR